MSRIIGHAVIDTTTNAVRQLDTKAQPDEIVTEEDVQEPKKLARLLTRILSLLSELRRRFAPRRHDYDGVVCTSSNTIRLRHGFGGKVRWWVVDWTSVSTPLVDSGGDTLAVFSPMLTRTTETTTDMLVLQSHVAGTATIRVEDVG